MGVPEVGYFRGSGGIVFDFHLPLSENYEQKVLRGELVRVNADGSNFTPAEQPRDDETAEGDGPVRPALNASKNEWVGYARAVDPDLSVDDADAMTRNDLAEKYGK